MPRLGSFAATAARAFGLGSNSAALVATASPTSVSGTGNNANPITITTAAASVMVTGGHAPYTHSWSVLSGSFTITSPSAGSTTFSKSQGPGNSSGVARDTVTDGAGHTATADVAVDFNNTYVAPNPPVWNVASGTNMGTFPRGGTTQVIDLYATVATPQGNVIYVVPADFPYPAGQFGPEFSWPKGISTPGGTGHLQGAASAGCTPGDYTASITAINPNDSSSASIAVIVTVT